MASNSQSIATQPGDVLIVLHDFKARSDDEINLKRGDRIELIERDDEFGDGWFIGKHLKNGLTGLFPEVYTQPASKINPKPLKQSPPPHPAFASPNSTETYGSPPGSSHSQNSPQFYPNPISNPYSKRTNHAAVNRSISLGSHTTNPVMDQTLSVIEEHITDMNSPSKNYLAVQDPGYSPHNRRTSYINGHETDEEDTVDFTEQDVRKWTPHQVAEHLEQLGADRSHCEVFKNQEISGDILLDIDRETIMLKDFDLGPLGRRLGLLKKIQNFQAEVKGASRQSDANSNRSSTTGAVLPKIPSVNEPQNYVNGVRQRAVSQSTHDMSQNDQKRGHYTRPSGGSAHSLPHSHSRRHSSIDANNSLSPRNNRDKQVASLHVKQGSFDQSWSMSPPHNASLNVPESQPSSASGVGITPSTDGFLSPASPPEYENPDLLTTAVDIERGYFSSHENESGRKTRSVLRKRDSGNHSRAPSDNVGLHRLSGVFRNSKAGRSTDSLHETNRHSFMSAMRRRSGGKTSSLIIDDASVLDSIIPPVPTQKIDSPLDSPQSTQSHEKQRSSKTKSRLLGLRAISDTITGGGDKKEAKEKSKHSSTTSPSYKNISISSPIRPDSSNQSFTSTTQSTTTILDEKSTQAYSSLSPSNNLPLSGGIGAKYVTFPLATNMNEKPKRKSKHETSAYLRGLEKKVPSIQIAEADYSGWMRKKSKTLGKWHSRLFVLRGCRLSYYYTEDDTEEKGLIDISYHRVLPASKDLLSGFYATLTGASAGGPVQPSSATLQTAAAIDNALDTSAGETGTFIFKLVPPRAGMSKAVNFTEPKVHFFAVQSVKEGRRWMAALMKATIEHDERKLVSSTYKEKTMSLSKARELRVRPAGFEEQPHDNANDANDADDADDADADADTTVATTITTTTIDEDASGSRVETASKGETLDNGSVIEGPETQSEAAAAAVRSVSPASSSLQPVSGAGSVKESLASPAAAADGKEKDGSTKGPEGDSVSDGWSLVNSQQGAKSVEA